MNETIPWSRLYAARAAVARRYRRVWSIPLIRRPSDAACRMLAGGARVLEVGAGDRGLGRRLQAALPGIVYESLDIDRERLHDYYDMKDVQGPYDAVIAFEVIEHLSLEDGLALLRSMYDVLAPGGVAVLSTPNVFRPGQFHRDASHRTAYAYDELGGLVTLAGLELHRLWRTHNDPLLRRLCRRYVFGWLFRLLGLDYAASIVAVGRRTD